MITIIIHYHYLMMIHSFKIPWGKLLQIATLTVTTCHFAGRDRSVKSSLPRADGLLSRPWDQLDPNNITPKNEWKRVFKVLFARVDVNLLKGKWYILISSDFKLMDSIRYYQIRHWILWDSPHVICTPSHQHVYGWDVKHPQSWSLSMALGLPSWLNRLNNAIMQ